MFDAGSLFAGTNERLLMVGAQKQIVGVRLVNTRVDATSFVTVHFLCTKGELAMEVTALITAFFGVFTFATFACAYWLLVRAE
jgi:hypothetical protein